MAKRDEASPVVEPVVEYFTPLADADVPAEHQAALAKYRALATGHGVPATTAVCYRVRAGFTLKSHASKVGPCFREFRSLQDWEFSDELTANCLVLWVPSILAGSTMRTKDKQVDLIAKQQRKLKLRARNMRGLGSSAMLSGLILAHFKATGERIPLPNFCVRTNTCSADGYRLTLSWLGGNLACGFWRAGDGSSLSHVGAFAIWVEVMG